MLAELFCLMVTQNFSEVIENAKLSMIDYCLGACTRFSPAMKKCSIKSGAGAV